MAPAALNAPGTDADHAHKAFTVDVKGHWSATSLHYVPLDGEVANYISLIQNWSYANSVLQSNEGPSFEAHQYAISGQSGGLPGSSIAPIGMFENPNPAPLLDYPPTVSDDAVVGRGTCFAGHSEVVQSGNMQSPYPGVENATPYPCNEYNTILDNIVNQPPPQQPVYDDWQYVAYNNNGIWAAPMAVTHLYNNYVSGSPPIGQQPFAVDPDAENFVLNLQTNGNGNPPRPFAALTFVTPCVAESDHPNDSMNGDGPQWLAYVLNAIGASPNWDSTAVIVTWDDWGGFYDNYSVVNNWPYHPPNNHYGPNPSDPNEWGFRVPLMLISPYVTKRGYISSTFPRSQGAILNFIENSFNLPTLNGDDFANGGEDLSDMQNLSASPLPWVPLPTTFVPAPPTSSPKCPHASG